MQKVRSILIAFFYIVKLKNLKQAKSKRNNQDDMAGVLGFEPRDAEIKTRCLTAWRYPNRVSSN